MRIIVAALLALVVFAGCKKGEETNPKTNQIKLTGKLPTNKSASLDVKTATKVLLFNVSGEHTLADIANGTFTVQLNKDEPVGLIFTNADKAFLGYLKLNEGIASLPLNYLNDTVSVVNLGELTTDGTAAVSSGANILTQVMKMSDDQIRSYQYANINFSYAVKNPDADQNGVVDLLEGKFYRLAYMWFGDGGAYNKTPSKTGNINLDAFRLMFFTSDVTNTPSEITFSKLVGNENLNSASKNVFTSNTLYTSTLFMILPGLVTLNPQFQVIYKNQTLYFGLPDFSSTVNNFIYIFPTLNFDSSGKIAKVSWVYYSGLTGGTVDASKVITDIVVQFDSGSNRIYDSPNISPNLQEHTLATPIAPASVSNFYLAYNDIFGNHVVVRYHPQ